MNKNGSKTIVDTHILIWSLIDKNKLTNNEITVITDAQLNNSLYISSISLWEIAMLVHKKKISIFGRIVDFLEEIEKIPGLQIAHINSQIASESIILGDFHGDPADRIIVATTKVYSANLITRDQKIIQWSQSGIINVNKIYNQKLDEL